MTDNDIMVYVASILTTLLENPRHEAPSGHMYAALMSQGVTLDNYNLLLATIKNAGFVTVAPNHIVTLTEAGVTVAQQCEDALKK